MLEWWEWMVVGVYGLGLLFIFAYSLAQLHLLLTYVKRKPTTALSAPKEWPPVLVQLPVYNEFYVVERLIDAVAQLDYPRDRLHIQLLNDSTDDSRAIAARRVAHWREQGLRIDHMHRQERTGFKAGALAYGLLHSNAPFVAIFDADFIPQPDFLRRILPHFATDRVGMVQTRWEHLNREYSLLTRVQAFALDAHFTIEQSGRNRGGHFINFNGTAGVWRRACIEDAGGWSADTLTEDLDLSYRAQMRGWQFCYVEELPSPAELPAEMNALKSQQYRWNKGAAECARKHLWAIWRTPGLGLATRVHAFFHLLNSSVFIWIALCAVLSLPLMAIKGAHPHMAWLWHLGALLLVSFMVLGVYYYLAWKRTGKKGGAFVYLYPAFLSMSMGLSLHNAWAVLQGYAGRRTPFVRTPKWNLIGREGRLAGKRYTTRVLPPLTGWEGLLAIYFVAALSYGIANADLSFAPLHAMLAFGFGAVVGYGVLRD